MECPDSNGCPHCGDGYRSSNEGCDDGNVNPNDGCTADCRVEATETEPNDVIAQANELVQPFYAEISPIGDSDIVELAVGTQPTVVEALELDSSACASGALDIQIEMLDATGTALLASDDDGGEGLCARLEVVGGAGGAASRYLRVSASSKAGLVTFPYRLQVSTP